MVKEGRKMEELKSQIISHNFVTVSCMLSLMDNEHRHFFRSIIVIENYEFSCPGPLKTACIKDNSKLN